MQNLTFDWLYFIFSDCDDLKDPVDHICILILYQSKSW